jgi:hypothetical protein
MTHNGRRPGAILQWRPVVLFGGGFGLSVFEAVQPMFGRNVEWAIVSLAATMMGLEFFQRAQEPKTNSHPRPNGPEDGPVVRGRPGNQGGPVAPASQASLAVRVALAVRAVPASRLAPAAAVGEVGLAARVGPPHRRSQDSSSG